MSANQLFGCFFLVACCPDAPGEFAVVLNVVLLETARLPAKSRERTRA